ncbi:MAG: heme o synthase [Bacteriovoracaceae bacterium]
MLLDKTNSENLNNQKFAKLSQVLGGITLLLTFTLITWGGVVHNTESSLACPDWPLCYGEFFPKMVGNVFIEHGHRLLASLVGFFSILLVIFTRKLGRKVYFTSWAVLVLVIIQGLLGGLTVYMKLPTMVSTFHLALSMIYTLSLLYLNFLLFARDSFWQKLESSKEVFRENWKPIATHLAFISLVLFYGQMLLGAFMRHSGAGAACGLGEQSVFLCFDMKKWGLTLLPLAPESQLHWLHRIFAVIVTGFVSWTSYFIYKNLKNSLGEAFKKLFWLRVSFVLVPLLILFQVALGLIMIWKNLAVLPTTLHLSIATLVLMILWVQALFLSAVQKKFELTNTHSVLSDLFSLTKPKLSGLVLISAVVGLLVAPDTINFFKAVWGLFLIGLVVVSGAALNCYMEKDVDGKMNRTKDRPLPSGRLPGSMVLFCGIFFTILGLGALLFWFNLRVTVLTAIASLTYVLLYTPMKRKSAFNLFVGAIPGALPPMLGYSLVSERFNFLVGCLFAFMFFWQVPHFFSITLFHKEDYSAASLKVYTEKMSYSGAYWMILLCTVSLVVLSALPSVFGSVSKSYLGVSLVLGALMLINTSFQGKDFVTANGLKLWARRYFYSTIIYLPLVMLAMVLLKN